MSIRGTTRPETRGHQRTGPDPVRFQVSADWPGIPADHPRQWCEHCTRAWLGGRYVIKVLNAMCPVHRGVSRA